MRYARFVPRTPAPCEDVETVANAVDPALDPSPCQLSRVVVIEGPDAGKESSLDPSSPSRALLGTLTDFQSTKGTFVEGVAMGKAYVRGGEVVARFDDYAWHGNIRELRNAVARCIALGDEEIVRRGSSEAQRAPSGPPPAMGSSSSRGNDWLAPLLGMPFPIAKARQSG
jgi:hypothetical protein